MKEYFGKDIIYAYYPLQAFLKFILIVNRLLSKEAGGGAFRSLKGVLNSKYFVIRREFCTKNPSNLSLTA